MAERHTADSITSDALDALYDAIDRVRAIADEWARAGQDPNACIDMDAAAEALHTAVASPESAPAQAADTEEQPMPACTATIQGVTVPDDETLTCTVTDITRHPANHVGPKRAYGNPLWTDHHAGATPHQAGSEEQH